MEVICIGGGCRLLGRLRGKEGCGKLSLTCCGSGLSFCSLNRGIERLALTVIG